MPLDQDCAHENETCKCVCACGHEWMADHTVEPDGALCWECHPAGSGEPCTDPDIVDALGAPQATP